MKYSQEAVRRHPMYKHGFEQHRKCLEAKLEDSGLSYWSPSSPVDVVWSDKPFEDSTVTVHHIWLSGAHSGLKHYHGVYNYGGPYNPEPIYDENHVSAQLQLQLL